ncbi:retrotransposon hot spot (RHS) protein, partial [Trypanosoma conorhini]
MPPKRTRARAAESPVTDVPLPPRHARAEPDSGDSTAPPAQRRRVEAPAGPQWALISTVEEVLLEGLDATRQMTLSDFIRRYVAPNFVLDEEHNVMMGVLARRPEHYIRDEWLLGEILNSPEYQFLFDARRLMELDVGNLQRWGDFEHKEIVFPITRTKLNNALAAAQANERARQEAAVTVAPVPVEGVYDSVFNAKWGYVESGHAAEPLGMRVVEANSSEPRTAWS